jgi:hypothetical protein
MPVSVKIEYLDQIAIVEEGVRAEEKQGSLLVFDKDGAVKAKFSLSKVEHCGLAAPRRWMTFNCPYHAETKRQFAS